MKPDSKSAARLAGQCHTCTCPRKSLHVILHLPFDVPDMVANHVSKVRGPDGLVSLNLLYGQSTVTLGHVPKEDASRYTSDFGSYGDDPLMREVGSATDMTGSASTADLAAGTARATRQLPGLPLGLFSLQKHTYTPYCMLSAHTWRLGGSLPPAVTGCLYSIPAAVVMFLCLVGEEA